MTANYQVLNHKQSQEFFWIPPTDLQYATHLQLLPLHAGECAYAASTMPLAFAKIDTNWQLVAVSGLAVGTNLFIKDGQWLGHYCPRSVSTYGFDLYTVGKYALLRFDTNSPLACSATDPQAQSLFNDDGSFVTAVQTIQDQLLADQRFHLLTQQAIEALAAADVLRSAPREVGQELYILDEPALAKLDDEAFLKLRRSQALGMAYAVNFSQQQYHILERLERINPVTNSRSELSSVDTLFGEGEDDTLKFDF